MTEQAAFRPAWWLPGPHLQTVWPYAFRPVRRVPLMRERLELADGDFIDLDWSAGDASSGRALILPGLEGSSGSAYVQRLLRQLGRFGIQGVVMHFRGCSGEPNRLPRSYHAGDTDDLAEVVRHLLESARPGPIVAIGYSLGGNILLKWLGETGADNPLAGAVAVSVPFELQRAADRLERGTSRIYQHVLLRALRRSLRRKLRLRGLSAGNVALERIRTLREFDDKITAPLHGFLGADDYYRRASCRPFLSGIARRTLIIHAEDDPFLDTAAIPQASELPEGVELILCRSGGHVGFASGWLPGVMQDWLAPLCARRIREMLANVRRGV